MEGCAMHTRHPDPTAVPPEGVVACEVCLTEIPPSVATSHEGADYVHYFCGQHCYVQWKSQESATPETTPANR
jgi:YHS domain-containing protein